MRTSLHHLLEQAAHVRRLAPALTYKETTTSYADLWHQVLGAAAGLAGIGLERGDRVAVFLESRIETVVAIFATSAAGGVFVPVNPLLRPQQVSYILRDCEVRVLVTSPERLALLEHELKDCFSLESVVLVDSHSAVQSPTLARQYPVHPWTALSIRDELKPLMTRTIDLDMAAILYTSGSPANLRE